MNRSMTLALALAASACAHSSKTVVLSLSGLDCAECAREIVPRLAREPGVEEVRFDKQRVEVTLAVIPAFDPERAVAAVAETGFHATVGAGRGRYVAGPAYPEGADAKVVVDDGHDVPDLAVFAVPGKVTVIDFYADWCGPCKEVDRHLAGKIAGRTDLAVRKLNVVDWESPLARHHLAQLSSLPAEIVLGRDGRTVATISGLDLAALDRAIDAAAGAR